MPSFNKGSYTEYSNKIGLYSNSQESFISQSPDVVLNFPYKDCVLEGGMTKADAKRDERFLNIKLDKRDVDTLFDPKVLTNFKYIDSNSERELSANDSIEFFDKNGELKQNLLIKGNNLVALHTLMEKLAGRVKLIYIDPPYNTGNDGFKYNDSFNHSAWLTFMRNRLEVARQLLSDDGLIFVSIDDHQQAELKCLMSEIFPGGFVNEFVWINNLKGRQIQSVGAAGTHEYILCFSRKYEKIPKFTASAQTLKRLMPSSYKGFNAEVKTDAKGTYIITNELYNSNPIFNEETRPNLVYDIFYDPLNRRVITTDCDNNKTFEGFVRIPPHKNNDGIHKYHAYRWSREKVQNESEDLEFVQSGDSFKVYTKRRDFDQTTVKDVITDITTTEGNREVQALGYDFTFPKPESLVSLLIEIGTTPNDIVLDFCLGSGTTAAVAHKMGRRWIGIEQMDYIETIAKERLKKVIAGEQGGISKSVNWQGGGSFVYLELKKYNQEYIDQINAATNMAELEEVYKRMYQNAFLKFWFDKKEFEKDEGFRSMDLNTRKRTLIGILDENQLYLNYADMNDAKYHVSDDERALTRRFYGDDPNDGNDAEVGE